MPKTTTVTLGGREYAVQEKPMGVAAAWRKKLRASRVMLIFESLDQAMLEIVKAADNVVEGGLGDIEVKDVIGAARVLPVIANGLANSIDEIVELLFAYEPALESDREWLLENAYDEEAVRAFTEVVKLSFPIMATLGLLGRSGSRAQSTSTNSALRNGASGLPPGGPQKASSPKTSPTSLPTPGSEENAGNIENKLEQT